MDAGQDENTKKAPPPPSTFPDGPDSAIDNIILSEKDVEFVWSWLLHEDNLLTNRVNFFLVAESMLVAAYATLITSHHLIVASHVVEAVGIVIAAMWWYVSRWSLRKTFWRLRAVARKGLPIYDLVCSGRKTPIGAHRLMGEHLPRLIALMWIILALVLYGTL